MEGKKGISNKFIGRGQSKSSSGAQPKNSKSSTRGSFSVFVGPQKQRFMIKPQYLNHPLFKNLLEEAESEYGFISGGPLALPCSVDSFRKVLSEISGGGTETPQTLGCGFAGYGAHHPLQLNVPGRRA